MSIGKIIICTHWFLIQISDLYTRTTRSQNKDVPKEVNAPSDSNRFAGRFSHGLVPDDSNKCT